MGLKLEKELAVCPLGNFKISSQGHYCFDDSASMKCLNCLFGAYENGPNLFDVCKAPTDKTREELDAIIIIYEKSGGKLAPDSFQRFLKEKGYIK